MIARQGEIGTGFFLIVSGSVRVIRGGEEVAVLGPGEFFGELSVLDGQPRVARSSRSSRRAASRSQLGLRAGHAREPSLARSVNPPGTSPRDCDRSRSTRITDVEAASVRGAKPVGTVTFLFTDIEGSTRLAQRLPIETWRQVLGRHRMLIRAAIQAANGHEEKTEGDGIFAVFERVDDGVAAAADAQRRLAAEPWPDGSTSRSGWASTPGDGRLDADGEYVGADVHRAARVAGAGHGGQVLLSEASSSLISGDLPEGTELRSLGEHRLKDLRPEKICQLTIDGLRTDFPPIRSHRQPAQQPADPAHELRRPGGGAGRGEPAARIHAAPDADGPGGTGKTRASRSISRPMSPSATRTGPGSCRSSRSATRRSVASAIAGAIGLVESGGRSPLETSSSSGPASAGSCSCSTTSSR